MWLNFDQFHATLIALFHATLIALFYAPLIALFHAPLIARNDPHAVMSRSGAMRRLYYEEGDGYERVGATRARIFVRGMATVATPDRESRPRRASRQLRNWVRTRVAALMAPVIRRSAIVPCRGSAPAWMANSMPS